MKKLLMVLICVSVLILLAGTVFATDAKSTTETIETKEIAVRASMDVGENLTKLLEKLAKQIGTTADKIFPWYVKQQIFRGYLFLIINGVFLLIGIFLLVYFYGKADWKDGNRYAVLSMVGGIIFCLALFFGAVETSKAITQIYNPEYHALQNLVSDMAQLVGK